MNLLIVEDDKTAIESYSDNIQSFNKTSDIKISFVVKEDLSSAKDALISPDFDGAIVDLKLSASNQLEGLEIVNEIEENQRFPIYIVSGSIAQVTKEENSFFKKKSRDSNFKEILNEIVQIYQTGITKILGKKGDFDKYLNNIFWKHLSNSMEFWINDSTRTSEEKQKSLLRHTISHMHEYIDEEVEKYHPSEFYIIPPIKTDLYTGDIVKYNGERLIVLTPSCDMVLRSEGRNAERILFCKILELKDKVENISSLTMTTSKNNRTRTKIESLIDNKKQNTHFIPVSKSIEAGIIDFQSTCSFETLEVEEYIKSGEMKRLATISLPFIKDIISRYTSYFARQGSPDFDIDEVYHSLF